ncbi:ZIP family metal transporter, partial [bacterium]|nr:ZIP family metal transporter [bacterium]
MNLVAIGFLASLIAGLATGVGALPALVFRRVTEKTMDILLGGAAGVMLAATSFSLIVPGIDVGNRIWPGWGVWVVVLGMAVGAVFLDRADKLLPHEHFVKGHEGPSSRLRKIWLFI